MLIHWTHAQRLLHSTPLRPQWILPSRTLLLGFPRQLLERLRTGGHLPESVPFDCQNVTDLWHEWKLGMNGQRSMEELEQMWGIKWRQGKGQGPWWTRRKRILDEIERVRASRGCSIEAAVAEIELLRASNSWSISQLYEHYVSETKKQRARAQ
jgi:Transcriptional activator of glycolytic enzymes